MLSARSVSSWSCEASVKNLCDYENAWKSADFFLPETTSLYQFL